MSHPYFRLYFQFCSKYNAQSQIATRLSASTEDFVARITQAGNNIALIVQMVIH